MNSGQEKKDAINILKCGAVDIDIDNETSRLEDFNIQRHEANID